MYRILLVDDEEKIRTLVKKYAVFEGHEVYEAENGMAAVSVMKETKPDIVVMDAMMPELDGFSAVKEIRKTSGVPIIMLSARGEEYDRIHGFETGADDYVVKPFSPRELMLRIDALMKRAGGRQPENAHEVFKKGGFVTDFTARLVEVDGVRANLTPKGYDLLFFMIRNHNIALDREKILTEVWGYDYYGDDRTLDTHIKELRKSLGDYSSLIVTVRGVGYRFDG